MQSTLAITIPSGMFLSPFGAGRGAFLETRTGFMSPGHGHVTFIAWLCCLDNDELWVSRRQCQLTLTSNNNHDNHDNHDMDYRDDNDYDLNELETCLQTRLELLVSFFFSFLIFFVNFIFTYRTVTTIAHTNTTMNEGRDATSTLPH